MIILLVGEGDKLKLSYFNMAQVIKPWKKSWRRNLSFLTSRHVLKMLQSSACICSNAWKWNDKTSRHISYFFELQVRGFAWSTYSNTELSFWSPQMRISVMERMVSTRRFLLWSVTVVFLVRTWYIYLERHGWRADMWRRKWWIWVCKYWTTKGHIWKLSQANY